MMSIVVFVVCSLLVVHGFRVGPAVVRYPAVTISSSLSMQQQGRNVDASSLLDQLKKQLRPVGKVATAAMVGASLFLNMPVEPANAVPSGGRSGGSSFGRGGGGGGGGGYRSPSSTRLGGSRSGYGGGYSSPTIITTPIMPMYSPFGGFGYSPFGFSPFGGFMPINLNLLIIGGIAYAVYTVLSNRIGGSDFSDGEDGFGALGSGATVLKIQVALSADWSERNNIMNNLAMIASKNSAMAGRSDLAQLLSDASLALLRKQGDWNSAAYEAETFNGSGRKAEPKFQQLAVKERAKFEEEKSAVATIAPSASGAGATQVVVSIVVALRGRSTGLLSGGAVRSPSDVARCLQGLAADALTDEGDNVLAVEVLWTPSEPGNTISPRELIEDYPELIRL